jgi:hypothetical protein
MPNFSAKVQLPDGRTYLKIGELDQSFKIKADATDRSKKVRITVTVGCDPTRTEDLLASGDSHIKVSCEASGEDGAIEMTPKETGTTIGFNTGTFSISLPAVISLEEFVSNSTEGDAAIDVSFEIESGDGVFSPGEKYTVTVKKSLEVKSVPTIRYFKVNPAFILHAGEKNVEITFFATGYDTLTLSRNNTAICTWDKPIGEQKVIDGKFPVAPQVEKPSITSVYRLTGKYQNNKGEEVQKSLDRIVEVISPGWNQVTLPQGSPIHLVVAKDLSGTSSEDRLYGIFRDDKDKYSLYSSATGVDDWSAAEGEVPAHMGASPCVYYKNKLWLIGGSSVALGIESGKPANEVWWYEKKKDGRSNWTNNKGALKFPPLMKPRIGHACLVFPGKTNAGIWVIGGYNDHTGGALQDIWLLKEEPVGSDTFVWKPVNQTCSWDKRLNLAATLLGKKKGRSDEAYEVWIYGGSADPTSAGLTDLWSTTDGTTWNGLKNPLDPNPGEPRGAALVARSRDMSGTDKLSLLGSFKEGNRISSFLFEWHPGTGYWESYPVLDGWQQFQGENFYMQAVGFNRFLFCWSLQTDPGFTGKLNVLVSH